MTPPPDGTRSFGQFVESALYGPDGFFTAGHGSGRQFDFLTSPEVGPLFGAVVARFLDAEWERLGRPGRFTVVDVGAGRGALARSVLAASPRCWRSLRYVCVDRSPVLRERADQVLGVEAVRADLPSPVPAGVVLANELLDNLPFTVLERTAEGWAEVRVRPDGPEVLSAAAAGDASEASDLAPAAVVGARLPLQREAGDWLRAALGTLRRAGRVVVIDHGDTSPSLAVRPWLDWVRTYRGHQRGGHPLEHPGTQDITCEVAFDQLALVRAPDLDRSQAEWLRAHGIAELVEEGRVGWRERAAIGDLEALKARSRVSEAEALCDPSGLGAFRVLEWVVG